MITVQDVELRAGARLLLEGVTFRVQPGDRIGLVGRNGAGKTTLMRSLMGHLAPAQGRIVLDGKDLTPLPRHARAALGIGYMPEDRGLVPELSVEDNIFLGGLDVPLLYRRRRLSKQARAVLDQLGLGHVQLGTPVETLSIGERQLVEIARLLVRDARLLILDEPTATLSKPEIERVFRATRDLVAQGRTR